MICNQLPVGSLPTWSTNIRYSMKTRKPRNHVAIALSKRSGSGSHTKTTKQLRGKWKRDLEA